MTTQVVDQVPRIQYTATASQTIFPYGFLIFVDADITVEQNGTIISAYTVTGATNTAGGSVILTTGATVGDIITVYRSQGFDRETDYQASGDFLAETVNDDFNRIILMLQQNRENLARTLQYGVDDLPGSSSLPALADRIDKMLGFDASGNPVPISPLAAGAGVASNISFTSDGTSASQSDLDAKIKSYPVTPTDYGIISGTGQSSAVRVANAAAINLMLASGKNVTFPPLNYEYDGVVAQTIDGQTIEAWGTQFYTYHNDDSGWRMGSNTSGARIFKAKLAGCTFNYRGTGYVSGTVAGSTNSGFEAAQTFECNVEGVSANYYYNNVWIHSAYTACYYNRFLFRLMEYGYRGLYIHAEDVGSDYGFVAANTIYAQRIQQCTRGVETKGDNIGTNENRPGDNMFIDVSIEHGTGSGEYGILENGANTYLEPRIDGTWTASELLLGSDSIRATVTSSFFDAGEGLNMVDNGTENFISARGYKQERTVNQSTKAQSVDRSGANALITLNDANLIWTASGTGTATYYLTQADGNKPQRDVPLYPTEILENSSAITHSPTIASLSAGEWGVGDQDSLGFKTLYVRLSDGADPDAKANAWLQARGMPMIEQLDSKTYSPSGSQLVLQGLATPHDNGYFQRGVNSETGAEIYRIPSKGGMAIVDGQAAPTAIAGMAWIFVDSADGDLKVRFGDGTLKTIVVDT